MSRASDVTQEFYNDNEFNARNRLQMQVPTGNIGLLNTYSYYMRMPPSTSLEAAWIGDQLVLARTVRVGEDLYVQGCWLDWPNLKRALLDEVRDLLPNASLESAASKKEPGRMLAALPVRIVPGDDREDTAALPSPIRLSLAIAWTWVVLGAGAVAGLLIGAVRLSERRGAFVSAVTHELRTPLTTFRIYTDLLAESGVRDQAKQRQYVETLSGEADRLSHLVENVLAYARLSGKPGHRLAEPVPIEQLVQRVSARLSDRATRAGKTLVVEQDDDARRAAVRADETVCEQILLNLVDNACKYARSAEDNRIHLHIERGDGAVVMRVRDHGPGIADNVRRRLFRPFSKSAHEAAESAAGIGLGLALSRRLARDMGGDLCLDESTEAGACFALRLPTT
jgi:signal transduction histidine kinase